MQLRLIYILVFLFGIHSVAEAQLRYDVKKRHVNFELNYLGVLDLPSDVQKFRSGAHLGIGYSIVNKYKEKLQKKTQFNRIIDRDIYINLNVATYKREDLHQALLVTAGPSFRITLPEGIYFMFEGDVGYMRTFLKGEHFEFDGNDVSNTNRLGNDLFAIQADAGVGWNFHRSHDYPVFLSVSAGLMTYFPNNSKWLMQPYFNGGIGFVLARIKETYQ
ncbi:MAG: hypothetical protein GY751_24630 [Bacteroidetes bacterium]|nr:hypothetical protein [Bacteroidota bacterium]